MAATSQPPLDEAVRAYVASSYPHNHDYRVRRGRLAPRWKLARRLRRLRRQYPAPLGSLVDLACCKGYFVLEAAARPDCERALGIDVHEPDLAACRAVRAHLGRAEARFERLRLHELADRIGDFGGPFGTALLVNAYQYLYFGSGRDPHGYRDHAALFAHLRAVCDGVLVFSNRLELEACPGNVRRRAAELGLGADYTEAAIRAAAERHFTVAEAGRLGRIPLWRLRAR